MDWLFLGAISRLAITVPPSISLTPVSLLSISAPSPSLRAPKAWPQAPAHLGVAPNYQGHSCGLSRDVRPWFAVLAVSLEQNPSSSLTEPLFPIRAIRTEQLLTSISPLTARLSHSGCRQDQQKDSRQHKAPVGAWLVWPWPWLDLLEVPTHRICLLGYLTPQVPKQNPSHRSLHQTGILPIVVMKKLELREEKGFIQGSTANHHLQCTGIYELPPLCRPFWGILAPTTKILEYGPLYLF